MNLRTFQARRTDVECRRCVILSVPTASSLIRCHRARTRASQRRRASCFVRMRCQHGGLVPPLWLAQTTDAQLAISWLPSAVITRWTCGIGHVVSWIRNYGLRVDFEGIFNVYWLSLRPFYAARSIGFLLVGDMRHIGLNLRWRYFELIFNVYQCFVQYSDI